MSLACGATQNMVKEPFFPFKKQKMAFKNSIKYALNLIRKSA